MYSVTAVFICQLFSFSDLQGVNKLLDWLNPRQCSTTGILKHGLSNKCVSKAVVRLVSKIPCIRVSFIQPIATYVYMLPISYKITSELILKICVFIKVVTLTLFCFCMCYCTNLPYLL